MFEVEVAEHAELGGGVGGPGEGLGFEDGDHVHGVDHEFHGEEADEETQAVEEGAAGGDAGWTVAELRDVVVEG